MFYILQEISDSYKLWGGDHDLIFRTKTRTKPKTRELNPNGHFQMDKPRLGWGGLSRASLQGHVPSTPLRLGRHGYSQVSSLFLLLFGIYVFIFC